jgi:pimeloyl-ACP methyl ester carboxylesterase
MNDNSRAKNFLPRLIRSKHRTKGEQEQGSLLYHKVFRHSENAPWITLIHGAGGSSAIWFKQIRDLSRHFNVLMVDLRGHGKSRDLFEAYMGHRYTFEEVSRDVLAVLDHLRIRESHFAGISLGTILIRVIAELEPVRVKSMILAGAITRLNFRSQFLVMLGKVFRPVIPFMWLYRMFANIIMPRNNHKESRLLFINEARKLYKREIDRWFKLLRDVNPLLRYYNEKNPSISTLYLMGSEDHLFLDPVRLLVANNRMARLEIIPNSGHVCNVDQPDIFNRFAIDFIRKSH